MGMPNDVIRLIFKFWKISGFVQDTNYNIHNCTFLSRAMFKYGGLLMLVKYVYYWHLGEFGRGPMVQDTGSKLQLLPDES